MKAWIKLLRPEQYYKNLVIFLHIIFSQQLTNLILVSETVKGFIVLCLISSINYIINDIKDKESDKLHKEKITRPLASGKITTIQAIMIIIILALISISIMTTVSWYFNLFAIALFIATQLYTFYIKKVAYYDVIFIAINFVLRTLSGVYMIGIPQKGISPWLVLCPFFLALFLASGKRYVEYKGVKQHKEVLKEYTEESLKQLHTIAATLLIIAYSLYITLAQRTLFLITLPPALYTIFRYSLLLEKKTTINTIKVLKDKKILVSSIIWIILVISILYGI